jgi:hypothetical protein
MFASYIDLDRHPVEKKFIEDCLLLGVLLWEKLNDDFWDARIHNRRLGILLDLGDPQRHLLDIRDSNPELFPPDNSGSFYHECTIYMGTISIGFPHGSAFKASNSDLIRIHYQPMNAIVSFAAPDDFLTSYLNNNLILLCHAREQARQRLLDEKGST